MLAQIVIGKIKREVTNEDADFKEDEFVDAVVLVRLKGIRMVKMVQAEPGMKYVVEITYKDGTTITLGAHLPELGDPEVWTQEKCAEIIGQLYMA